MTAYPQMTAEERKVEYARLQKEFDDLKAKGLNLNMARGKPSRQQIDQANGLFDLMRDPADYMTDGIDVRTYGELAGIPAAKRLFADVLGCKPEQVFVGGNSSLQLMYDTICKAYTHGLLRSERPWCKEETVKWLCPVPGYDRHFKVTETFGFELIAIPTNDDGPDMDAVEQAVKSAIASDEVSVIIAQRPCALLDKSKKPTAVVTNCKSCGLCMRLGCPAISMGENGVEIDPNQCNGCGVCVKVCPFHAIEI